MHRQCPPLDALAVSYARYHVLLSINVLLQLRLSLDTRIMVNCLPSGKTDVTSSPWVLSQGFPPPSFLWFHLLLTGS